jgi:hypothetical protein
MPPKTKKKEPTTSKKNEQKKKAKSIDDRTFGLKNKNRSKKVQQQISSVTKAVLNSGDRKQRAQEEQRKKVKADARMRKKADKEEQDALFGEALMAITKKKTTNQKEGKNDAIGRDAEGETNKKGTSRAMKMMFQMDAQEMEDKLREDVSACWSSGSCKFLEENRERKIRDGRLQFTHNQRWLLVSSSPTMYQLLKIKSKPNDKRKWQNSKLVGKVPRFQKQRSRCGQKINEKSEQKLQEKWWKPSSERRKVAKDWESCLEEICSNTKRSCSMSLMKNRRRMATRTRLVQMWKKLQQKFKVTCFWKATTMTWMIWMA